MATKAGNDDLDDFLTCSICLDKFNIPKYLPCLHTFCEGCIQTYITSGLEKGETHSFQCPVCRCIVPAPNENCNAVECAKKLPLNFLIVGLLEKEKVKRPEKRCMSCERIGEQTEAAFICVECSDTLCNACYKCHTSNKASASHKIMSIFDISTNEKMLNVFQNLCSIHADEKLKLYCVDHDLPCCSMCVSINHRKCEALVSIDEMATKFASTKTVESVEAELSNCSEDVTTVITHNKDVLQDLMKQFNTSTKKLEEVCTVLMDEVRMFETRRKGELQKKFDQSKDEIERRIIEFENCRKTLENDIHILKVSKTEASEVQVMLEYKRMLRQVQQHKSFLKTRAVNCNTKFKLTFENVDNVVKEIQVKLENMCKVGVEKICNDFNLCVVENTKSLETFKFNRFTIMSDCWGINNDSVNAICLTASEDVQLVGFLTYECPSLKPRVTLSLKQGSILLAEVTKIFDGTNSETNIISVELQSPVNLKSETKYDIVLKTNEQSQLMFVYGLSGQDEVKCADVIFKFEKSLLDYAAGNTPKKGQIPGIIFRKIN